MAQQRENNKSPQEDKGAPQNGEQSKSQHNWKKTSNFALVALLVIVLLSFFPLIEIFTVPLILAITFTTILYPVYNSILRITRNRRKISSLICCSLFLIGLVIPVYIIINLSIEQLSAAIESSDQSILESVEQWLFDFLRNSSIAETLGITEVNLQEISDEIRSQFSGMLRFIVSRTYSGFFGLFINVLVLFFTMFYFFADGPFILEKIRELIPLSTQYEEMVINRFTLISRATVIGTLVIGLAQGTAGGLTLLLGGIRAWLLWAFVMMILSIIPLVGAWLVLIPAAVIQILNGNVWTGIGIFLSSTFIVSNIDNLIRPRVVGHGAKIHDLLIFLSTLGGLAIYGVMGFIIGPTIAAVFITIAEICKSELNTQIRSIKDT